MLPCFSVRFTKCPFLFCLLGPPLAIWGPDSSLSWSSGKVLGLFQWVWCVLCLGVACSVLRWFLVLVPELFNWMWECVVLCEGFWSESVCAPKCRSCSGQKREGSGPLEPPYPGVGDWIQVLWKRVVALQPCHFLHSGLILCTVF